MKLDNDQKRIVDYEPSPGERIVVKAGAGAGKSTVFVHRIKKMVDNGVDPSKILLITFTNKSALDLKQKIHDLGISGVEINTMHSHMTMQMRKRRLRFITLTEWQNMKEIRNIIMEDPSLINRFESYETKAEANQDSYKILSIIDALEMNSVERKDFRILNYLDPKLLIDEVKFFTIYDRYLKALENSGSYPYNHLITDRARKAINVDPNNPFETAKDQQIRYDYIFHDESHDSTIVEFELIRDFLSHKDTVIYSVYDPQQSIYGFRYSQPDIVEDDEFWGKEATHFEMRNNYRSHKKSVDFANLYREVNGDGFAQVPNKFDDVNLSLVRLDTDVDEIERIIRIIKSRDEKFNVLLRTNSFAKMLEVRLTEEKIPHRLLTSKNTTRFRENKFNRVYFSFFAYFLNRDINPLIEIVDLINGVGEKGAEIIKKNFVNGIIDDKVKEIEDELDQISLPSGNLKISLPAFLDELESLVVRRFKREVRSSEKFRTMNKIIIRHIHRHGVHAGLEGLLLLETMEEESKVDIYTFHGSKGLSLSNVIVCNLNPFEKNESIDDINALYVAMTRTKDNMWIIWSDKSLNRKLGWNGKNQPTSLLKTINQIRKSGS